LLTLEAKGQLPADQQGLADLNLGLEIWRQPTAVQASAVSAHISGETASALILGQDAMPGGDGRVRDQQAAGSLAPLAVATDLDSIEERVAHTIFVTTYLHQPLGRVLGG
jgi:hypothetical protein